MGIITNSAWRRGCSQTFLPLGIAENFAEGVRPRELLVLDAFKVLLCHAWFHHVTFGLPKELLVDTYALRHPCWSIVKTLRRRCGAALFGGRRGLLDLWDVRHLWHPRS